MRETEEGVLPLPPLPGRKRTMFSVMAATAQDYQVIGGVVLAVAVPVMHVQGAGLLWPLAATLAGVARAFFGLFANDRPTSAARAAVEVLAALPVVVVGAALDAAPLVGAVWVRDAKLLGKVADSVLGYAELGSYLLIGSVMGDKLLFEPVGVVIGNGAERVSNSHLAPSWVYPSVGV